MTTGERESLEQGSEGQGRGPQRLNKKVAFGVLIILVAVGSLMATNLRGALTYYLTVEELLARGADSYDDRVRVGGRVLEGTIQKDAANNLSFVIYHNQPATSLPVRYKGIVPDIFGEEVDVIVEGSRSLDGSFHATNLLTQHPPEFKVAEPGRPHEKVEDRSPE